MNIGNLSFNSNTSGIVLMGILNVTPDSFSDGGHFFHTQDALDHALQMIEQGVDIIDIGGESSRPGAVSVSIDEELGRVIPIIQAIRQYSQIPISIDTTKSVVAANACEAGANMINDISAMHLDVAMPQIAANCNVPICLMHMQGTPDTMQIDPQYDDIVSEIIDYFNYAIAKAIAAGIKKENIILDPGIGFGKTVMDNLCILENLNEFKSLGYSLLIGSSRKSFIGHLSNMDMELLNNPNIESRQDGTLATIPISIEKGATILRMHDVLSARRFIDIYMHCRCKLTC